MAFQPGNTLAVSRRTVENVLRKAAHRNMAALDRACTRVILDAADHDSPTHRLACLSFVADRLDGRARQMLEVQSTDARELDLAAVMQLVLQARAATAEPAQLTEGQLVDSAQVPADPPPPAP